MAKKNVERTFRIAVVGLSGDEKIKGSAGVGKSCLCNRFVRPHADHFYKDHISIISQIDFSGQVINNDHFLYWGEVTKDLEDGSQVTCSIVELTEFIDDQSFQPLRGHGDKDYKKRCKTTLTSAEKLMYICKDQLGDERNYERKIMPDGKFVVDGFIVVFDVSHVQNRPPNKQSSYIMDLLSSPLHKSKKPCVLVATKCEEPESTAHEEVKSIRDKKKITLIETSAFENVNVDFAFLTLVNLIDRSKRRPMEVPFITGIKRQKEILDKVEDAYMALLSRSVTDYHAIWNRTRKELADEDNYLTYLRYFGKEIAAKKFKNHIRRLKEAQQQKKKQQCLETLPLALRDMLPDLASIGGRDWRACQEIILKHPNFHTWFVRLPDGDSWKIGEYLDSETKQIALDFLKTNAVDCERCFKAHDDRLKEALKRERMKVDFGKLLYALNDVVLPGRQLEDTLTHLVDEESYKYLSVAERKEIYDAHQFEITEQAKKDFVELLLELVETFEFFDMNDVNAHMEGIIKHSLQKEERYKNLDGLIQERRLLLMKHAAFVDNPCRQTCPFQHRCMDDLINQLLEQRVTRCSEREPQDRWSEPSTKLNLVILGENGLADELANEIRAQSVQEEYTLDNVIYSLELRPIDGDVQRPQNNLCTPDFTPQGCICTFSSPDDLRYVTESLRKSNFLLTSETQDSIYATLQPEHPVILLFARDLSIPESDIAQMRHDINKLAEKLFDCTIIDIPTDEAILWHGKKFHETQIHFSIKAIVESNRRSGHDRDDESHDGSQCDPNLRLEPSLYDTIVGSNNKVHSFLSSGNGTSTPSSRGSDDVTSGPSAGSGPPTPAAKAKRDLTQSQSQFKSNSPALKRKNPPVKTPSVGEGSGWEDMISDDEDNDEPVMSIGMAMMCGDPNLPELVLGPIVSNDTCCRDLALKQTVNVDMFLNTVKRRVSIEITSFHQAKLYTEDIHHGYILVYSAKRRASFETLKFFVQSVTPIPIEIVAVSDSEKFSSDYEMQALITEGNKLADETKNCTFITAGANFGNQSLAYSTFFTDAYEKMAETETIHEGIFGPLYDEDSYEDERQGLRTPVETPQSGFGDPTYAKPQIVKGVVYPYPPAQTVVSGRARALSAGEVPSTVAPPPPSRVYDHLVRPSDIKNQQKLLRNQDKRSDDVVYDQPERFATSPRRFPNNKNEDPAYGEVKKPKPDTLPRSDKQPSSPKDPGKDPVYGEVKKPKPDTKPKPYTQPRSDKQPGSPKDPGKEPVYGVINKKRPADLVLQGAKDTGEEPTYGVVNKSGKPRPEPPPRRRNSAQSQGSKDTGEDSFRRRCKTEVKRRSQEDSSRTSSEEGFVENIIYDRGPGNGDAGMVRNPIYDSAEGMPQYRPKPAVPPKPLNMANYQHVAEKLSKPRDPIGGGGAGLVRPNHLPFTGTTSTTPRHPLRAPLATPEKGVFSSPMEAIKHALGVGEYGNSQDVQARGMRQRGNRGHAADDGSGDVDPSDPTYAAVIKKPGFDKVVNEFEKQLPKGNTSSDSDSKGSAEADRYHPHRKKRGSFRKRKNKDVRQGENNDNSGHQDDGTYAEVVFSPGVEGVDPKVRNRQLREEEKNRKKEEKRKQAADKKMVKAQKRQQPKQRQKSNKKNVKKPPAYAPYLDTKPKGEALETLVTEEDPVPKFVKKCIEFIDREGVGQEGIYRVSGKQADCDALTVMFKEDPNISIEALDISCHAVASAVKAFFKNLPDPLIPREQQAELLQMFKGKSTADFLDAMPEFFNKLSPIRLATLRYLMQHFGRVSANSEVNKMAAQNLTVCWWPTLLHPEFKSLEEVANESQLSAFVEQWVQHSEKLFGVTNACPEPETETEAVETEGVEWQQEAPEQAIPEDPMYAAVQPRANAEVI
ncbi:rho GTPase-activating protein 5-like isoform X5 [Patiria miniata]|uniref:Rho GTPase-activating protein 5 n=1 Tax=Patiria miniata TaxID=46514 RepID=A0A913ZMY5_PATMI|nr:rho GTPase-activating protein 5-like isoform X5 [Patiria miniata]